MASMQGAYERDDESDSMSDNCERSCGEMREASIVVVTGHDTRAPDADCPATATRSTVRAQVAVGGPSAIASSRVALAAANAARADAAEVSAWYDEIAWYHQRSGC